MRELLALLVLFFTIDLFIFTSFSGLMCALVGLFPDYFDTPNHRLTQDKRDYGAIFGGFFMFIFFGFDAYSMISIYEGPLRFLILRESILFAASVFSVLVFVWAVKKLCSLNPRLGEALLVSSGEGSPPAVDIGALYSLTLCIANIVLCVLWYWLKYNPEGTVNPSWTGIFG
jgi:hypothetical protein